MSLEHILLGMLHEPASGYDLRKTFEQEYRYVWSAELSQIYPTLQRMQRRGWLKSGQVPSEKGPPRRVYRRTPKGTTALHAWLRGEPLLGAERFAYLAQLLFLGELHDLDQTLAFFQQLRAKLAGYSQFLEAALHELERSKPGAPATFDDREFHDWLGLSMGVRSLTAKVSWCEDSIAAVKKRLTKEKRHV
jgi:PadR family transcriptional regulator, regulatory protein AphA